VENEDREGGSRTDAEKRHCGCVPTHHANGFALDESFGKTLRNSNDCMTTFMTTATTIKPARTAGIAASARVAALVAMSVLMISATPMSPQLMARPQNPDEMLPAPSAAKAKEILTQAVAGLGGPAYLNVRNSECTGRAAQFEHSGAVEGYLQFRDYKEMPDKNRMEYGPKSNIVDLYAGDQGWTLDRGGVSDVPALAMADYLEAYKTDVNTILRYRLGDAALVFRYGGSDVVDLKEADWVEIADHEGHTIRVAFDKKTSLPIRTDVTQRDHDTGDIIHRATYYTSYHLIDGIQTPFQISRFRNEQQVYQMFYENCQYNTAVSPEMFTRASLDNSFGTAKKNTKGKK
jgi:hypothetical protein